MQSWRAVEEVLSFWLLWCAIAKRGADARQNSFGGRKGRKYAHNSPSRTVTAKDSSAPEDRGRRAPAALNVALHSDRQARLLHHAQRDIEQEAGSTAGSFLVAAQFSIVPKFANRITASRSTASRRQKYSPAQDGASLFVRANFMLLLRVGQAPRRFQLRV
ncbi:predicted protein [Coccidioides posadasii str. Silveira]|uniref:Predicted protein n=1 Tax=Coccidioides posadasii (strain RMSCC 757 / Silveira) TaxID=443226 RepID=E9D9W3_COCPS|nr:predicted protein [Coccidioides posadasii str. Silveira]